MGNYKKAIYSKYYSSHAKNLYGEISLDAIHKNFIFWNYYYEEFLPMNRNLNILDIGCGNGGFVHWLHSLGYENAYGVDTSAEQIAIGGKLGVKNIREGDLSEFLEDNKDRYDVIFARDVMEHFSKDEILRILELVYNALNEGGKFVIQSPNGESPWSGRYRYGDFTHETVFTWSSLMQIFSITGFKDVLFKPAGPVPHGLKSGVRFLLWKCIEGLLKLLMLVETGSGKGIFTQNIIACGVK